MADKPFPTTEPEANVFLQNLASKLPGYTTELSVSASEITQLTNGAANFNYLLNAATQVSDSKEAFTDFKQNMFYGEVKGPSAPPVFPAIALPMADNAGIVTFVKALLKRIKASAGYTKQIGEDLGLIVDTPDELIPGNIVPEINVKAVEDGQVEIKFSKNGLDAIRIDWRVKDATTWELAGSYTTSPAIHDHPSGEGKPEAREYRGRLLKKNEPVSQYSATYNVVTTP
jgi:hypothetical protein